MLNKILIFSSIVFLFISFQSCEQEERHNFTSHKLLKLKHGPADEFFRQRMDPNGNLSIEAYIKGLKEAKSKNSLNARSITGFDDEWTVQGPGNLGGRINTIAVNPDNENIIYTGFSLGGAFKTIDKGENWEPIFDNQLFSAIGDITIDPNDSNTIYLGTGDPNIGAFPSVGDGLYRSEDAGETWTNIGLVDQRIISRVIVNPNNSNIIFAATMGLPFVENNERGLYRSIDRGQTWEQVLFIDDSAGVIDLVINPQDPNIMFAASWERIINNRQSSIFGENCNLYKTTDGGDNWTELTNGLPIGPSVGRIGLAICESQPNVVYAQYSNDNALFDGIYRSNDNGDSWFQIPTSSINAYGGLPLGGFAWFFGQIRVSPTNPDDLYLLGVELWRTQNAGQTWDQVDFSTGDITVHPDKHDLVYLSDQSILLGTDGGMYLSNNNNLVWTDMENIPTSQFYRVGYNPHQPNTYYGGSQDNGTSSGNSQNINNWDRILGGDGFQPAFDTENPNRYFAEAQTGFIRITLDGGTEFFSATYGIDFNEIRNWDMPYFISAHNNNKLFTGTNRAYRSISEVPEWTAISPVLTKIPSGLPRHRSISTINESPIIDDLIYVGTSDGNVWYANLNDSPTFILINNQLPDQYVTDVAGSYVDPNRLYVTHSGYRDNDNLDRIHRSDDMGATWIDISSNLPEVAINEMLIIPNTEDNVIFLATDVGVYGTIDAGESWDRLGTNMTIIPVYDLVYNEINNELVVATYGRSIQTYDLSNIANPDVEVSVAQVQNNSIELLKVFPNPANEQITVSYNNIDPNQTSDISIISLDGKLVKTIKQIGSKQVNQIVDISGLSSGQYYVKVKAKQAIQSVGFVKQ